MKESAQHLCSFHGHEVGLNDALPVNPNARRPGIRTRTNNKNELFFIQRLEEIMQHPKTQVYHNISVRGENATGYYTPLNFGSKRSDYNGFFTCIIKEGANAGRITKAQPISVKQLARLNNFGKLE